MKIIEKWKILSNGRNYKEKVLKNVLSISMPQSISLNVFLFILFEKSPHHMALLLCSMSVIHQWGKDLFIYAQNTEDEP